MTDDEAKARYASLSLDEQMVASIHEISRQ
jgi:hypothetical protein